MALAQPSEALQGDKCPSVALALSCDAEASPRVLEPQALEVLERPPEQV